MISREYFNKIQKEYNQYDIERETLIKKTRDVIKLSKHVIYATHRKDLKSAEQHAKEIEKEVKVLNKIVEKQKYLEIGAYNIAIQEYVEAICYFRFMKEGKVPTGDQLGVRGELYLLGICDMIGELMRKAVNSGIHHDYELVFKIKTLVDDVYDELMQFDFRNPELRKKVDGIKWELKKIDDMVFTIKSREKK